MKWYRRLYKVYLTPTKGHSRQTFRSLFHHDHHHDDNDNDDDYYYDDDDDEDDSVVKGSFWPNFSYSLYQDHDRLAV